MRLNSDVAAAPLPRHRHSLSRTEVRESQTSRVLSAAVNLFGSKGYAATSVMEIAKQAGISRKTIYELYETKEDIFLDTYRAVKALLAVAGTGEIDLDGKPSELFDGLSNVVDRLLSVLALAPAATRMFFLEALGAGYRVRVRRNEAIDEFVEAVMPTLSQLRAVEPSLPPLESRHGYAIVAAAIELIVQHLTRAEPETVTDLSPVLTAVVVDMVAPNYPYKSCAAT